MAGMVDLRFAKILQEFYKEINKFPRKLWNLLCQEKLTNHKSLQKDSLCSTRKYKKFEAKPLSNQTFQRGLHFENASLGCGSLSRSQYRQQLLKEKSKCCYNKRHTGLVDWNDMAKEEKRAKCERHYICADKSQTWCADDCVSCYIFSKCKLVNEVLDETPACWTYNTYVFHHGLKHGCAILWNVTNKLL